MTTPIPEINGANDFSEIEESWDETIDLLNNETIDALADSMAADTAIGMVGRGSASTDLSTDFWILYGCQISGTNPGNRTVSAGSILYQNQVYHVSAKTVTTTGVEVVSWKIKDNTPNIHLKKELEIVAGTAGEEIKDEGDATIRRFGQWIESTDNGALSIDFVSNTIITVSSQSYAYRYRRIGNTLDIHFRATIAVSAGASSVTRMYIPMPNGFTKKNPGTNFRNIGNGGFSKPSSPTPGVPMIVTNYDTGSEGNKITMLRNDGGIGGTIDLSSSGPMEIWGEISLEIQ